MGVGDVQRGAYLDELIELRCEILMHADAAVGAGVVADPAGVESVGGFEAAPVGEWRAFEGPAAGDVGGGGFFGLVALVGEAVDGVAAGGRFVGDAEVALWGGGGGRADGDGHGEEDFRAFDDVGALFAE